MNNKGLGRISSVIHSSSILFDTAKEVIGDRSAAESFMVLVGDFDLYRVGRKPLTVNDVVTILIAAQNFTERTARMRFERLLDMGLVDLVKDEADRRKKIVYLSSFGQAQLEKISLLFEERIRSFYEAVSTPRLGDLSAPLWHG